MLEPAAARPRPAAAVERQVAPIPDVALRDAEAERIGRELATWDVPAWTEPTLLEARLRAQQLPLAVRQAAESLRLGHVDSGCLRVSNLPVPDGLGPTPASWQEATELDDASKLTVLLGSLLGDPIGWTTQQSGKLVHDVLPMRCHEADQLGSGSAELLTLHTEDAFHPLRPDFVVLVCLRNPAGVATHLASIADVALDEPSRRVLREEVVRILPDLSHLPDDEEAAEPAYDDIAAMRARPAPVAPLFGHPDRPFVRYDDYFTVVTADGAAAYDRLRSGLGDARRCIALRPGEALCIDNHRAVHGRAPFRAVYDGSDRWLKRVLVTSDLRRSAADRAPGSRLIGTPS